MLQEMSGKQSFHHAQSAILGMTFELLGLQYVTNNYR
jgi:hypothetical protein